MLTDEEIYQNRLKVVQYLQQSHLKKAKGKLGNIKTGGRCCLGHMCDALGIMKHIQYNSIRYGNEKELYLAPIELRNLVELYGVDGTAWIKSKKNDYISLSDLNDRSSRTPQNIGKYLETVIMGGPGTPWKKINIEGK